jgi:hypothetical protein
LRWKPTWPNAWPNLDFLGQGWGHIDHQWTASQPANQPVSQPATAQHSTAQHSTAQHSTAQHSTTQHSTAQHCTAPHCIALHCFAAAVLLRCCCWAVAVLCCAVLCLHVSMSLNISSLVSLTEAPTPNRQSKSNCHDQCQDRRKIGARRTRNPRAVAGNFATHSALNIKVQGRHAK